MKFLKALGLVTVLAAVPVASHAQMAFATRDVNMRAGPAQEFPVVAVVRPGVALAVQGCLSDYRWCDVMAGPNRGWVYTANIVAPYGGVNVPVITYGATIGLGIAAFSVGSYWDRYYVGRPWYPQRQLWVDRRWPGYGPGYGPWHGPGHGPGFGPGGRPPPRPGYGYGGHPPPRPGFDHGGRPPPRPDYGPGGHRPPPPGAGGGGGHRPPPPGAGGGGGHRPPPSGAGGGGGNHRPPQRQDHGGGQRH